MTTDITELTGAPKHANQHRLSRLIIEAPNDELRQLAVEVEQYTDQLIEALEKAQQRISELESRTVKLPTTRLWAGVTECYEKSDVIATIRAAGVEVSDD